MTRRRVYTLGELVWWRLFPDFPIESARAPSAARRARIHRPSRSKPTNTFQRVRTMKQTAMVPNADKARAQIAKRISHVIDARELTQSEAAREIKDAASQLSLVTCGKLRGFSLERLSSMLARFGYDVTITATERTRGVGRISFVNGNGSNGSSGVAK